VRQIFSIGYKIGISKNKEKLLVLDEKAAKANGIDKTIIFKLDGDNLELIIRESEYKGKYLMKRVPKN
jgi:hypothetical protein